MVQSQEMFADSSIAVVTFTAPYAHMFGPPNDEAFGQQCAGARLVRLSPGDERECGE